MPKRVGPPKPRFNTGPNCDGCMYRGMSFGYCPETGPQVSQEIVDGVPHVKKDPITTEYLFILEAPGYDEVAQGRNAVGPTGKAMNKLLHSNTPIRRGDVTVVNTVRCRPVEWTECEKCRHGYTPVGEFENSEGGTEVAVEKCVSCKGAGQYPMVQDYNGDHVNAKPSPGQIDECTKRYMEDVLSRFEGKYIVCLGKVPTQYMVGRPIKISEYRGTIFEPGKLVSCTPCGGTGKISRPPFRCRGCAGKGHLNCEECNRATKHTKKCSEPEWPACSECEPPGSGEYPRTPKKCKECDGGGKVPADPDNPFVCEKLKEGQLLFVTYHPAALFSNPGLWSVVERDFSRLASLEDELVEVTGTKYDEYPPPGATTWIATSERLSVDLETSGGLDPAQGSITTVGVTDRVGYGAALDPSDGRVRDVLSCNEIVGQNFVLYDWWWLRHHGYSIPDSTRVVDTRYLGKLLNPDTPNDLTYLSGEFADPPMRGYWKTKNNYRDNIEQVVCMDVDATLRVYFGQMNQIEQRGQTKLVNDYIVPLSRVVFEMRAAGMRIDRDKMDSTREAILEELEVRRQRFPWTKADGSPGTENQHGKVQEYLYEYLELPVQKKRESGKRTANREALEELKSRIEQGHASVAHLDDDQYVQALEFIDNALATRDLSKLESSFLRYKLSREDFVHPALNMGGSPKGKHESGRGTATWRFSCTDPNAQQVPAKVRDIFLPDEDGWEIASVDLRQAEVVGFLWYAEEWEVLDKVLRGGMDAHRALAEKIVNRELPYADVKGHPDKAVRDEYKTTTFAMLYGETARTTALRLHRPIKEIDAVREAYFKMIPGVQRYRQQQIYSAMDKGYVESPFGFRRYLYITSEYGRAANQAGNMPIQNIPPVVIGRTMIGLHRELPKPARLLMQVHDELVLTYPRGLRKDVIECTIDWMRAPVPELAAPTLGMAGGLRFNIDIEIGPTWGDVKSKNPETDVPWNEEFKL